MWSKWLAGYLRRVRGGFFWTLLLAACFGGVLFLYRVRILSPALCYAALLASVSGCLLFLFGFVRYARSCRQIELLVSLEEPYPEKLPAASDLLEERYQELVGKLCRKNHELEDRFAGEHKELMDYFTLWMHQIKTPIFAMRLLLQNGEGRDADALAMELFQIEQYTDMALQYLRLGSTVNDFVLQPCDLDDMVRQALRKYAKIFIGRKLTLHFQETHLKVLTDEKWMVFVIGQILSNALKYTSRGGISIYAGSDGALVIEDTGIGIAAEDLPRIFEKGYTGFNGRTDKKATGLGLYLCRKICDKLGHGITAESEPGRGTRIKILTKL